MKYYDELTDEQKNKVLDKIEQLDLPLFSEARKATHQMLLSCRLYIFDDKFNMHCLPEKVIS